MIWKEEGKIRLANKERKVSWRKRNISWRKRNRLAEKKGNERKYNLEIEKLCLEKEIRFAEVQAKVERERKERSLFQAGVKKVDSVEKSDGHFKFRSDKWIVQSILHPTQPQFNDRFEGWEDFLKQFELLAIAHQIP